MSPPDHLVAHLRALGGPPVSLERDVRGRPQGRGDQGFGDGQEPSQDPGQEGDHGQGREQDAEHEARDQKDEHQGQGEACDLGEILEQGAKKCAAHAACDRAGARGRHPLEHAHHFQADPQNEEGARHGQEQFAGVHERDEWIAVRERGDRPPEGPFGRAPSAALASRETPQDPFDGQHQRP
ncbi:MAG: hypothetical protein M0Z85_11195 [Gammaproteobacteria bacterium]|nr:hypothetical protein [Gammaproteobacteria bacterium]